MTEFYAFATAQPFLTWCLALGIWVIPWVIAIPFSFFIKAYNRHLRSRNIKINGWPDHPLMDADGDIVHPPRGDEND